MQAAPGAFVGFVAPGEFFKERGIQAAERNRILRGFPVSLAFLRK